LGEIGSWQSGSTPNRARKDYYGGNIAWLRTGDLNDNYVSDIPCTVTDKALEELSLRINPAGSVLLAMYGATIGKVGILKIPATTNQACCACTNFVCISNEYLFYFLLASKQSFIQKGTGGAQPNISKEIIVSTKIPLPSLNEQHRIVLKLKYYLKILDNIYGSINDINSIAKNIKLKILDLSLNGLLTKQDSHDEPAIELLKRINPNFKPCDNSHYKNIPDGWWLCRLNDIVTISNGFAFRSSQYVNSGIRIIRITNVQDGKIDDSTPKYYPTSSYDDIKEFILKEDDLLMSLTGNVGRVCFISKQYLPAALNQRVACIRGISDMISVKYLYYYFQSRVFLAQCFASGRGIAQTNISTEWLKHHVICLPPISEQERIIDKINIIFNYIDKIIEQLT
jgi:type I restriction enzyme S subunit